MEKYLILIAVIILTLFALNQGDNDYVKVENIILMSENGNYYIKLETEIGNLTIFISECQFFQISNLNYDRPLTQDIITKILNTYGIGVEKITIDKIENGIFYATIYLHRNLKTVKIDIRPSDAIGIAVRENCDIYIKRELVEKINLKIPNLLEL